MVTSWIPKFDLKLILLCGLWYLTSVVSSSSSKMILREFTFPVTLCEVQFIMNIFYCTLTVLAVKKIDSLLASYRHTRIHSHNYRRGESFDSIYSNYSDPSYSLKRSPPRSLTPKKKGPRSLLECFPKRTFPDDIDNYNYSIINDFLHPSALLLKATIPMGTFQFVGQIANNKATSVIPVSLVHTIKALSPLTTVLIYRFLFQKQFSAQTYVTLLPIIFGVMLSCTKPGGVAHGQDDFFHTGCVFAFISMLIFVSQNIFAKKFLTYEAYSHGAAKDKESGIVNALNIRFASTDSAPVTPILPVSMSADERRNGSVSVTPLYGNSSQSLNKLVKDSDRQLDKISVLFYCSIVGFVLTLPFYLLSEWSNPVFSLKLIDRHVVSLMLVYGVAHFMQSIVAFQILGLISPINYSIANILKRIIVISWSIFLEGAQLSVTQWIGLSLTFSGLYAYDRWGVQRKH
ncbi:DEKNAAC105060 [Brettanomyces naardenensis]|uniref:DEKNAAC105060 n=1 Tax=Brettanomyces naardenensis TaxID=13370 RepID=A0A448YRV8_BRENA|nr:DEKNAAC105060 [Brettanomyces naardenensis]